MTLESHIDPQMAQYLRDAEAADAAYAGILQVMTKLHSGLGSEPATVDDYINQQDLVYDQFAALELHLLKSPQAKRTMLSWGEYLLSQYTPRPQGIEFSEGNPVVTSLKQSREELELFHLKKAVTTCTSEQEVMEELRKAGLDESIAAKMETARAEGPHQLLEDDGREKVHTWAGQVYTNIVETQTKLHEDVATAYAQIAQAGDVQVWEPHPQAAQGPSRAPSGQPPASSREKSQSKPAAQPRRQRSEESRRLEDLTKQEARRLQRDPRARTAGETAALQKYRDEMDDADKRDAWPVQDKETRDRRREFEKRTRREAEKRHADDKRKRAGQQEASKPRVQPEPSGKDADVKQEKSRKAAAQPEPGPSKKAAAKATPVGELLEILPNSYPALMAWNSTERDRVVQAFENHLARIRDDENLRFLKAVDAFLTSPSPAGAEGIFVALLRQDDGSFDFNLPPNTLKAVSTGLLEYGRSGTVPIKTLQSARDLTESSNFVDSYNQFVNQLRAGNINL